MGKKYRYFVVGILALLIIGILGACTNKEDRKTSGKETSKYRIYHADNGDIKVPKQPKRVVVTTPTYAGNFLALGITLVGVNELPKDNSFYGHKLDHAEVVTSDSLEKILKLKPDLIITYTNDKNTKKLSEIAPTVAFTYDKRNYLDQQIEIGKLAGKEKQAKEWVEKWKQESNLASRKIKAAIGEHATVTVMESYAKSLYIYGENWGRGTEVIYQALGLRAPEKVKKNVFGPGYKSISTEVIPQYAGDYLFVGSWGGKLSDNSYMETNVWKNIPAVKKNHVIQFDSKSFYFNDPISLEKELQKITNEFTKKKG